MLVSIHSVHCHWYICIIKLELSTITIAQSGENNSDSVHIVPTIIRIRLIANHHAETRKKIRDQDSEDGIRLIDDQSYDY